MIGNIIHTFGTKLFLAAISFVMLLVNANCLGSTGLGTIGLVILNITLVQLISNILNGSIIYFSYKLNVSNLIVLCYLWSAFSLILYYLANQLFPLIDEELQLPVLMLSALQSLLSIHSFVLIGKEEIKRFNAIGLIQSITLLLMLGLFYYLMDEKSVGSFISSLFIAYSIAYLVSLVLSFKKLEKLQARTMVADFKSAFRYGIYIQAANTFQLLNYRISYFILDAFSGRASLGLYTAGVQLSEALILPGKSIATVQYARISKKNNNSYAQRITIFFFKISVITTFIGVAIALIIPESFYLFLFGKNFQGIKLIILFMSLGILLQASEIVISHYFSGVGKQKLNSLSTFIGLITTVVVGYLLIPTMNAVGAAITALCSYSAMALFLFIKMNNEISVRLTDFLIRKSDFELVKRLLKIK